MKRREFITLLGGAAARGRSRRGHSSRRCRWLGSSTADRPGHSNISSSRSVKAWVRPAMSRTAMWHRISLGGRTNGSTAGARTRSRSRSGRGDLCRRSPVALAAKAATTTIPIVFTGGEDPVRLGLVASLQPAWRQCHRRRFVGRRSRREAARAAARDRSSRHLNRRAAQPELADVRYPIERRARGSSRRRTANPYPARKHRTRDRRGVRQGKEVRAGAMIVGPIPFFNVRRDQIVVLAARDALPTIYGQREFMAAGGLMSYATNLADAYRQAGVYSGRFWAARDRPTCRWCNRPSSSWSSISRPPRCLASTVPPALLARADEVIE